MQLETLENPKMLDIYAKEAWHNVFCYACAYEEVPNNRYSDKKLLLALVSGADSAIQSVKAVIDVGTHGGVRFGYGVKEERDYRFVSEYELFTEKGMYEKFPMTLTNSRKGLVLVHEDVLMNGKYFLSFEEYPAQDVAKFLGGAPFGLRIEPEWAETVYEELLKQDLLREKDFYKDEMLFAGEGNGLHLYEVNMNEEEADNFVSQLIKSGKIRFAKEGTGEKLNNVEDLGSYALEYNEALIEKLSEEVQPEHDAATAKTLPVFETYPRQLFPVQSHVSTACANHLKNHKAVLIQGEMSVGKSIMMAAVSDGMFNRDVIDVAVKQKRGYHACLMCPPSLTDKWPKEIRALLPDAVVHVIRKTEQLIKYHADWIANGRPKPNKPTFFIISFNTMRDGARIEPAVEYKFQATTIQRTNEDAYKHGFYCSHCGKPHQVVEDVEKYMDEYGVEQERDITHNMTHKEFGSSRRVHNSRYAPNAFCYYCGESLWTNKVKTRYHSFKEWTTYEKQLLEAKASGDELKVEMIKSSQPAYSGGRGHIRKIAAIEYIRRKMKNFFDISIVDEVHLCKGGNTAQGNALGSLAAVSKKVVAGTGTLFGGSSLDIYYIFWRLFPTDMVKSGYKYQEVTRFNQEYGNVEKRTFVSHESKENNNSNSRGGTTRYPDKLLPGISPFIYGKYMLKNVVNVRLTDVWPDPVELVDTPTIMVPMGEELTRLYNSMINSFKSKINSSQNPGPLYRVMMDYGIAMPDNPFTIPDALLKMPEGDRMLLWKAQHLGEDITLPKEQKLQEIITTELSEGRKSIVYVRDTGSTNPDRDVRPRLKKKLEEIGAKVCILDTSSTDTDKRSQWLENKIVNEDYDVCIVSQELVKVGLDLLCTPTLIFYQFSWSLFTINQAAKRAFRIGQTEECRLFYLSYENSMQEHMAKIIAMKNKATAAINGEISSDGLSALLGDDGDLKSLLLKSIKEGGKTLKGSTEDWISQTTDRAREILASIGKKKAPAGKPLVEQLAAWSQQNGLATELQEHYRPLVQAMVKGEVKGFEVQNGVLSIDLESALGEYQHTAMVAGYLLKHVQPQQVVIDEVVPTQEVVPVVPSTEPTPIVVATETPKTPVVEPSYQEQVKQEKPKQQTTVKQAVSKEKEFTAKIVVLKDVQDTQKKPGRKSKRREVTSENQLVLDLFA